MSVRKHVFPAGVDVPPAVEVRNPAGSVTVEAVEGLAELRVEVAALDDVAERLLDQVAVDLFEGPPTRLRVTVPDRWMLRTPRFAVSIGTPPGTAVRVTAGSADTRLRGSLGHVALTSASGRSDVELCTELQLRTASGDARIGTVNGRATVGAASADVRVHAVDGALEVRTASGDVSVGEAAGTLSLRTASGDVTVDRMAAGRVRMTTVSGDATVSVTPGLRVRLDLSSVSGRLESELMDHASPGGDESAELSLEIRSVSGDVRIRRVAPAAAH
ncbi:MAG TPA: DUF4097 family beta strand repeat-containing protein [Geodermatophilus sp.]|nr:DUF4097 family beta strand repeat-containing protein [Geodermatophilus sp.]